MARSAGFRGGRAWLLRRGRALFAHRRPALVPHGEFPLGPVRASVRSTRAALPIRARAAARPGLPASWRRPPGRAGLTSILLIGLLTACTTPPPPLVDPTEVSALPSEEIPSEIVIGVDSFSGGFNPHRLADLSTPTTALASLLLPSVFRPGPDGLPRLDTTLMSGAEVVDSAPFTVRYDIRPDASWSDSAPIAAEDFVYLWERMRSEPGVVDAAGYRLIEDIIPGDGGKTVEVIFDQPYPGWQSLFTHLLPAHLIKDAPGGWQRALAQRYPLSGGPFTMTAFDRGRGEIVLERNDRYWEQPSDVLRLVLRENSHPGLTDSLASGDNQLAVLGADAVALNMIAEAEAEPPLETRSLPRTETAQVLLRPASPVLADDELRQAVGAALDRDALIAIGTRSGPSADLVANSQVLAPSEPGYTPTRPRGSTLGAGDPTRLHDLLDDEGYAVTDGWWERDGERLRLVVAAPADQEPYSSLAGHVARQLRDVGIEAEVVRPPSAELYDEMLQQDDGTVSSQDGADEDSSTADEESGSASADIAVVPMGLGADPAATLATRLGCPVPIEDSNAPPPVNLAGFCDEEVDSVLDAALTGRIPLAEARAELEPILWDSAVVLPLFQLADTVVFGSGMSGAETWRPYLGPFAGASQWQRDGS
ncbi:MULTISPECIES: ABC transporter family substrate-binding protein [Actinoalloteichus]|uniref:ABC-type dipeptide transport system, periplasmic component n=1 Tax=Actinoalloteichus fjordicus TaxID=1612552 RepID=A0AAC9PQI2_9PSEU|nr:MULTISPECIES: ABC transporter family substrate-binding protein [Actinoalloteichus]APU12952.1 ABC-type dipeptide transport system, periplasmic component [Actinoalloteichus fjordicus]APU18923.1 ABC-type dipeptide transport system, periplasmic component [Actinoalloteichus sp. GBA129-24]